MNNSLILVTFLLIFGANAASFNDASSNVVSAANVLNKDVGNWSSAKGLEGALAIQQDFPPMSSALGELASAASSLSGEELDVQAFSHTSAELAKLLDNLSAKAADFSAVGAGSIAANDLKALGGPIVDIINGVISAGEQDFSKLQAVSSDVENIEQKVNDANKVYRVSESKFNAIPSATATSSEKASSTASSSSGSQVSSAKETGSAKPTGATTPASHATTTAAKGSGTVGKPASNTTTHTAPPMHNAAPIAILDFGAAALGLAALLM